MNLNTCTWSVKLLHLLKTAWGLGENGMYRSGNADLEVIVPELRKRIDFAPINELFKRKWNRDG